MSDYTKYIEINEFKLLILKDFKEFRKFSYKIHIIF